MPSVLALALRHLLAKKLRTALTVLGFGVVDRDRSTAIITRRPTKLTVEEAGPNAPSNAAPIAAPKTSAANSGRIYSRLNLGG